MISHFIYFIQIQNDDGLIKIGRATNIIRRFNNIRLSCPYPIKLLGICREQEKAIHRKFSNSKIRGEWFIPSDDIMDYINSKTYITKEIRDEIKYKDYFNYNLIDEFRKKKLTGMCKVIWNGGNIVEENKITEKLKVMMKVIKRKERDDVMRKVMLRDDMTKGFLGDND